jgi:4-hydroxybenzoate polyprenyltransferase
MRKPTLIDRLPEKPDVTRASGTWLPLAQGIRQITGLVECMRPRQWTKNLLVFAGLIFSESFFDLVKIHQSIEAFLVFCLISSSVYILNDLADIAKDKEHPLKRLRPLPSGRLKITSAILGLVMLAAVALSWAFALDTYFGFLTLSYFGLIACYSFFLKSIVILDAMVIAVGFVMRAIAGPVVIRVELSNWLLICTFFMALFLALCKRRHELVLLGNNGSKHRQILDEYSTTLLDQMLAIVTGATIVTYALYTMAPETVASFGTRYLLLTIPIVLFGIFRYLYLVYQKNMGGKPEDVLLSDRAIVIDVLVYGVAVIAILTF